MALRVGLGGCVSALCMACGGAPPAPVSPTPEPPVAPEPAAEVAPEPAAEVAPEPGLPRDCAAGGDLCLPPRAFVKRLCQDAYTGAALLLFEKSSPFSRGYVRSRSVKAVNTLGGPASDADLRFGEEVLILTHSGGPGANQMQVSGMGGYEVLRWDGTCATLGEEELARRPPTAPHHAPFEWTWIDDNIQKALLGNAGIEEARRNHRKHCHGVTLGARSASCVDAEAQLSQRIAAAVRSGMTLPDPERMP